MPTLTTDDVARCLADFQKHLLDDAIIRQRPVESYVRAWMGGRKFDDDCTREEFAEAVAHMAGEFIPARKVAPLEHPPVGVRSPFM